MNLYQDAVERVERGIKRLDEKIPGWYKNINTTHLDIQYPTCCVLGQISETMFNKQKDFVSMVEYLEIDCYDGAKRYGFCPYFAWGSPITIDNEMLNLVWTDKIVERQRTDTVEREYTAEVQAESVYGTPQPEVFDSELCLA
jgi:hypothetical protein